MKRKLKRISSVLALGIVFAMLLNVSAYAAVDTITFEGDDGSFTVNRQAEGESDKWGETLENAIEYANNQTGSDGEYASSNKVTMEMGGNETLSGTLTINPTGYDLTINGNGSTIEAAETGSFISNVVATSGNVTLADVTVDANDMARAVEVRDGTLTLDGETTITGGCSGDGGGVYIDSGATLVMNDESAITENSATRNMSSDGGGVFNKGTLIMNDDAEISYNTANRYGGGVDNSGTDSTLVMNDNASINHNQVTNPAGESGVDPGISGGLLNGGGTVTMNDNSSISYNSSAYQVGGTQNRGLFTMNDNATISNNTSESQGGGVFNYSQNGTTGTFIMNDNASVSENTSHNQVGGFANGATLIMNDNASISGNTSESGIGGAYNYGNGTIEMNGSSEISNNETNSHTGGLFNSSGTVTMNDNASVSGNKAGANAGGINNSDSGQIIMNDNASVSGNEAGTTGGGIFISQSGTLTMNDEATVADNQSTTHGGGIYISGSGTLTMNDEATVADNEATKQGGGIYNNGGTVEMKDSTAVDGNSAGTGIAGVVNLGTFTMSDEAAISNNTTEAHTGGIYNRGTFTMEDDASITGNSALYGSAMTINGASADKPAQTNLNDRATITGNTSSSTENGDINVAKNANLTIEGGLYFGTLYEGGNHTTIVINGGTFDHDPDPCPEDDRVDEDHFVHHHPNGTYTVTPAGVYFITSAVTTPPTCTEEGVETFTCTCGYSYTKAIPALGHDYRAVVTKPTCIAGGYTTYTCLRCGDSYIGDETGALGHDYRAVVTEPTCTERGYTTYTCTRCGDSYIGDETGALGHDYQAVVTEPTCTERGYTTYTCTRCDDQYIADYTDAYGKSSELVTVANATEELSNVFTDEEGDSAERSKIVTDIQEEFLKIFGGDKDGSAEPAERYNEIKDQFITREQFVYVLYQMAAKYGYNIDVDEGNDVLNDYTDSDTISDYAVIAFKWVLKNGIIDDIITDHLLSPHKYLTTDEMMILLQRFQEYAAG